MENKLDEVDQHILSVLVLLGKVVEFTLFEQKHFGRIESFDETYQTFIVKDFYNLDNGEKSTMLCVIELEFSEIEKVYDEPTYYFADLDFPIFSSKNWSKEDKDIFPIRFSTLANNPELLKFTPFVGNQIDEDNTKWFAGYLTALDRYEETIEKHVIKNLLITNILIIIKIRKNYGFRNQFIEEYNKLEQSVKE